MVERFLPLLAAGLVGALVVGGLVGLVGLGVCLVGVLAVVTGSLVVGFLSPKAGELMSSEKKFSSKYKFKSSTRACLLGIHT